MEPLVKPATPPPTQQVASPPSPIINRPGPVMTPPVTTPVPAAGNNSVMSQSAPGLLFDPSIIGNVQVVTPVGTTGF